MRLETFFLLTAFIFSQYAGICIFFEQLIMQNSIGSFDKWKHNTRAINDAFEARRSIRRSDRGSKKSAAFHSFIVTPGRSAHIYLISCPRLTWVKTEINSKGGVAALVRFPDECCHLEQMQNVQDVDVPSSRLARWLVEKHSEFW